MALGSTQPLVKMNTRDVPGGKGGRCVRLTTYHHIVPMSRNLESLNLLDPSVPAWPVMGELYLYLFATDQDLVVMPTSCRRYVHTYFNLLLMHLTLTPKFIISTTCRVTVCFHKLSGFRTISEVLSTGRYTKLRVLDLPTVSNGWSNNSSSLQ
jgi:hypothetical protein